MRIQSMGKEDPMEEGSANLLRNFTWETCTEELAVGYSPEGHKESSTTEVT